MIHPSRQYTYWHTCTPNFATRYFVSALREKPANSNRITLGFLLNANTLLMSSFLSRARDTVAASSDGPSVDNDYRALLLLPNRMRQFSRLSGLVYCQLKSNDKKYKNKESTVNRDRIQFLWEAMLVLVWWILPLTADNIFCLVAFYGSSVIDICNRNIIKWVFGFMITEPYN